MGGVVRQGKPLLSLDAVLKKIRHSVSYTIYFFTDEESEILLHTLAGMEIPRHLLESTGLTLNTVHNWTHSMITTVLPQANCLCEPTSPSMSSLYQHLSPNSDRILYDIVASIPYDSLIFVSTYPQDYDNYLQDIVAKEFCGVVGNAATLPFIHTIAKKGKCVTIRQKN